MTALIQIAVEVVVHLAGFTNSLIIEDSVTILTATSTFILVSHAIPIVFFICVGRTFTSVTIPIWNLKLINHISPKLQKISNLGDFSDTPEKTRLPATQNFHEMKKKFYIKGQPVLERFIVLMNLFLTH